MKKEKIGKTKSLLLFLFSLILPIVGFWLIFLENTFGGSLIALVIINRFVVKNKYWQNEGVVIFVGKISNFVLTIFLVLFFGFNFLVPLDYIIGWLIITAIFYSFFILQNFSQLQTDWIRNWVNKPN